MASPRAEAALGRYRLTERLAHGGMGEVFVATQSGPAGYSKPVALKVLLPHLASDTAAVQMFLEEARISARLSHPNVVHVLDFGCEDGRYFLALELVRGASLSRLIAGLRQAGGVLDAQMLAWIGRALCEGLHHAHGLTDDLGRPLGVIHRDVSPQNVLVATTGGIKIADFGIARTRDSVSFTQTGHLRGKCEYFAPEQFQRATMDQRVDLYAAAVTLFHCATLESPFRRDSEAATMAAVLFGDRPPLASQRPDLPEAMVDAIERALSRDPGERFATALEFRDALPAPTDPHVDRRLGALLQEVCRPAVEQIDERTNILSALAAGTVELPPSTPVPSPVDLLDHPTVPHAIEAERTRSRRATFLRRGVPVLVLTFALGGWALTRSRTASDVLPDPATSGQPQVVAQPQQDTPQRPRTDEVQAGDENPAAVVAPSKTAEPASTQSSGAKARPTKDATRPSRKTAASIRQANATRGSRTSAPGFLSVDSEPWSIVTVDGRKVGQTPLHRVPVAPGKVLIELENPESRRRSVRQVSIVAGKEHRLLVPLNEAPVRRTK